MSKQIIIIDSAEALAEKIGKTLTAWQKSDSDERCRKEVILSCLHPIEVPSDDMEGLIDKLEKLLNMDDDIYPPDNRCEAAAALITAQSRTVPRNMLIDIDLEAFENGATNNPHMADIDVIIAKYGYHAE